LSAPRGAQQEVGRSETVASTSVRVIRGVRISNANACARRTKPKLAVVDAWASEFESKPDFPAQAKTEAGERRDPPTLADARLPPPR
jgi:hypothetical protein